MVMSIGKNLFYSGLLALFVLGYALGEKYLGGENIPLWMAIYLSVLFFTVTFCVNHWKRPLKRIMDRMNEWAYDMSFWKIIVMMLTIFLSAAVVAIIFFLIPIIIFDSIFGS